MALIDPADLAARLAKKSDRFQLALHKLDPEQIIPNGDRYVVEVIDIDEIVELGQLVAAYVDPNFDPKDPKAPVNVEKRGVLTAVVVSRGNGHLLGLPDPRVPVKAKVEGVEERGQPVFEDRIERHAADVPMFFDKGDVVFVDHNARGRALRIVKDSKAPEYRIVNQIDILAHVKGVRLKRTEDGSWEQE